MSFKIIDVIKTHFETNIRVQHPTLLAIGISAAISAITVGVLYMADSSGMFGIEEADAKRFTRGSSNRWTP